MINKLLITCLQRNKRLVIPTLGAFIRKNIEGVGVILVFVPFLNKDDGVLCSAIKSWAGVDDEEAAQILEEYIVAVKKSLDERGQYIIEGVGVLKYDTNRIIYLAKESEAVKEEVVKPIVEQKAEPAAVVTEPVAAPIVEPRAVQVPTPAPEVVAPVAAPTHIPSPAPVINTEPKQVVEVVTGGNKEDDEPVKEPQIPQYNRPIYDRGQTTTDMGTRYFSPVRRSEENEPMVNSQEKEVQPKQNITSIYNQPQQRESTQNTYERTRGSQQRISSIYGSTAQTPPPPTSAQQQYGERQVVSAVGNSQRQKRAAVRPTQKKKGNDMVLWIAIIAVVLTVMVLVYGYIYGGEQTIDTEALIEQVQAETGTPATDVGGVPTE